MPEKHLYLWKGVHQPGVTRLLSAGGWSFDFSRIPEAAMVKARDRGTKVHAYAEAIDNNDPDLAAEYVDATSVDYIAADKKLRARADFTVIQSEHQLVHPVQRYSCRIDLVAVFQNRRFIGDRKTGAGKTHPALFLQLEGCRQAWNFWNPDEQINDTCIIQLRPDTEPRLIWNPWPQHVPSVWSAVVWRYWWLVETGEVKVRPQRRRDDDGGTDSAARDQRGDAAGNQVEPAGT